MRTGGYTAFLSYSHRDAAVARWLHRRLEAYRLPRRLIGSEGERGPVPERLTPIFRDREELPAAADLSEKIREALASSRHLIVVCSPHGAASPWVAKEIAAFRELHPGSPILAAIIAGEPPHCFPTGLCDGSEPLAADLRPERDGRRLGFLKLVAGLAGVGLDRLLQRDASRRIRRVTAVTAVALAAMLAMVVMTSMALTARADAERQRAEAEGLVEFMLTGLRDRLSAVGRLDIMEAVNARALARCEAEAKAGGATSETLARCARLRHAIAEDRISLGKLDDAEKMLKLAYSETAEQTERYPEEPDRWIEHIKSLNGLGRLSEVRDHWEQAIAHYRAAAEAAERLLASAPDNPDFLTRAAAAALNLGNVHFSGTHDYAAAERHYIQAVALFEHAARLRPRDPHVLMSQANALGWLADSFFMREMWPQSLDARWRQIAIIQPLHDRNPHNAEYMFRLAAAERGLAHSLLKGAGHDRRAALEHLMEAHRLSRRLSAWDPRNKDWTVLATKLERDFGKPEFRIPTDGKRRNSQLQRQEIVR